MQTSLISYQLYCQTNIINKMVKVNYESYIRDLIGDEVQTCQDKGIKKALSSEQFQKLLIKLYQYCEELNMIKRRIQKLKFYTQKSQIIMPKLIDSEIKRIDDKAKQIGTAYSLFLIKQRKFKVLSNEASYYEKILNTIIILVVDKCFSKQDSEYLSRQVNRLFRTNTFNSKSFRTTNFETAKNQSVKKPNRTETNFRLCRRQIMSQKSQIKPYVNNKSCFKSLMSRSPIISLWHPNSEFLEFTLAKKQKIKKAIQL